MDKRVFGFGSAAVDFRIRTAEMGPGYTAKLLAQRIMPSPGGATANALTQIARLGGHAALLAKLGQDGIGRQIITRLEEEHVDTGCILVDEQAPSPFNVAVYAGEGMRRVGGFLLANSLAQWTEEELHHLADNVTEGDFLLVEIGEIPLDYTLMLCRLAREKGARIVVDVDLDPILQCGGSRQEAETIFSLAEVLIPNVEAMASIYGDVPAQDMARDLAQRLQVPVIMTRGAQGSLLCQPDGDEHTCPAFPVEAVDTVGAGDAFHGSLVFALSQGQNLKEAMKFASWCAAQNCLAFGATAGMVRAEDLIRYPCEGT